MSKFCVLGQPLQLPLVSEVLSLDDRSRSAVCLWALIIAEWLPATSDHGLAICLFSVDSSNIIDRKVIL